MSTPPLVSHDPTIPEPLAHLKRMGTAEIRESLGTVLNSLQEGVIVVNRTHPRAVLLSIDYLATLLASKKQSPALEFLTDTYRQIALASNTPAANAAADKAFAAGAEVFASRPLK